MQPIGLDRHQHGVLTVDLCGQCQGLWFDAYESTALSAAGTLQLFRAVHAAAPAAPSPLPARLRCPRCDTFLDATQDLLKATRFSYYRCRHGHGRFTPFVQFLREKHFVRPVEPADLERLKKLIRVVRCSSCGAPIDLERQTACGYCRAPLAILDTDAVAGKLRELDAVAAERAAVTSPEGAAAGIVEAARFERAMRLEQARRHDASGIDLIGVGLAMLAALVRR